MEILFGYAQDELVGHPLEILLPESRRVAHVAQRLRYMQTVRPRPMGSGLDLVGRRKDGSEFPADISLRPILIEHALHVMGAIRDLTAQRLAERERTHIAERLRLQDQLISMAHDAILICDPESYILSWNEGAEHLYGWTAQEAIGKVKYMLLQTRSPISQEEVEHALQEHGQWEGELIHICRDGRQVTVESRQVLTRDDQGVPTAILEINRDITKHRLLQRLHLQDQLISMAHDAILVRDLESHILSWNEGAEHLYGWTAQEATGKVKYTLLQTRFPISQEEVEHALQEHGQWEGELIHICRDGRQVIVESRQVLTRDDQGVPTAILEINRDITERRRLEHLEQKAHAERDARLHVLQLILDYLPSGVFLAQGPQLRLLMANQAMTDALGAEWQQGQLEDDLLRQHGIRFFTTDGRPLLLAETPARLAMASGEPVFHFQMVIRRPDGTHLPALLDAIPFEHLHHLPHLPQEIAGVITSEERVILVVYHDVTALKEAEALKDQFVSLATHELRTPVSVIAGYADLFLRRAAQGKHPLDEWQVSKLREMKQATQQLANLTEDLLDATRVQSGQFQLDLRPTDLLALTRGVIERLQTTTTHHQVLLHTTLAHLWATVDAFRIEQVLSNLLNNAIKYSPQGGPIEVTLEEERQTQEASFSVRDHGMGIPREQQPYLFRRFMRANNVRAAGIRGTGLGLYLCQELVERHGGHIYFKSEEGVGSTFFFSLPLTVSTES
jgi:PAS domain S-box-containing protein